MKTSDPSSEFGASRGSFEFPSPRQVLCFLAATLTSVSAQTIHVPDGSVGNISGSNVGIGTSTPGRRLDVNNDLGVTSGEKFIANFTQSNGQNGLFLGYRANGSAIDSALIRADNNLGLTFGTSAANEAVTISNFGNVGIGVSVAADRLTIGADAADSNVRVGRWVYLGQESSHLTTVIGGNARAKGSSTVVASSTVDGYRAIRMRYDQGITFHTFLGTVTADSVIGHERMRIDTDGNVGVGTTSPTHKLSVNGTIRAKEIIVDTGWADYVFADDYRLAPLAEVEAHIKEHRHLPGIPSATEVAEQGVSVGEMQSRILAKVEELTLHLIELKKENQELRRELDAVRAQTIR